VSFVCVGVEDSRTATSVRIFFFSGICEYFLGVSMEQQIPVAAKSRRRSATARLLRLWIRIPPGSWNFCCCECCVFSQVEVSATSWSLVQRNPTDWCVVCDLESSRMTRPWRALGRSATRKKIPGTGSLKSDYCGFWYFVLRIVCFNTSCWKYAIRECAVVYLWSI